MVLLSDGLTNQGITDPREIARLVADASEQGVTTSALGLGVEFDGELLPVAQVSIRWKDPRTGEVLSHAHLVSLDITDDVAQVKASRVPWATVHASTAVVGRHMQWASEAWERGQRDEAQRVLEHGSQRLAQLTRGIDDPRIAQLDDRMDRQRQQYTVTVRDNFEGKDLGISSALRALGYLN